MKHMDAIGYKNESPQGSFSQVWYKKLVIMLSLLSVLVWGTVMMVNSISEFRVNNFSIQDLESYLKSNSPPLLTSESSNRYVSADSAQNGGKIPLNLDAIRQGKFKPKFKSFQWINTPESLTDDKGTYVIKEEINGTTVYSIKSVINEDYRYTLYEKSEFEHNGTLYKIDDLVASPDLKSSILRTNTTKNWRHSSFALYWILDIQSKEISPLFNLNEKISVTLWSPDSENVAFIVSNNIYIKNIKNGLTRQVTSDGSSSIFNGRPDWVYEEEVFSSDTAMWWSPNGDKLAYLKTHDEKVPSIIIPYYVQDDYDEYPEYREIKYPKAGFPNPIVDMVVFELKTLHSLQDSHILDPGTVNLFSKSIKEKLITEVLWVSDDEILVKVSNRASDVLEVHLVNHSSDVSQIVRKYETSNSWFEITKNALYIPRNETLGRMQDGYIDTVESDGYNHLAYFSPSDNPHGVLLTKGFWEVCDGVASFDAKKNLVYFSSTQKSSIERHIYSVNLLDVISNKSELPQIHNFTDTSSDGWYTSSFSSGSRYLLLTYAGPDVPYQRLLDLDSLNTNTIIEDNKEITDNLALYDLPKVRFESVSLGYDKDYNEEIFANSFETLPLNFDENKKYPVIFFTYGGPGSQLVMKTFAVSFSTALAAELNCVVVTVDGRGTGFNNMNPKMGSQFKFIVRDNLGKYEPRDQISAARVWSKRPYVDSEKIAIWGWSYGGFLTLKTLETDIEDRIFSYGASVAPVTKWKLYDSVYTERYMRTPQENRMGYNTASIGNVSNFRDVKRFLVMHGSGDDNVHFQNTLKLLDEFNLKSIENYDFMVYPDSDHSISYHNANTIVYDRLLNWFGDNFK